MNSLVLPESRALPGRMPGPNWQLKFHHLRAPGPPSEALRNVTAMHVGGLLPHRPLGCTGFQFEAINKADVRMKARLQLPPQSFSSRSHLLKGEILKQSKITP